MTRAYLIAEGYPQAQRAAVIDWGWEPLPNGGWRRPDGLEVTFCVTSEAWRGAPRGAAMFTGPGRWASPALGPNRQFLADMQKRFRFCRPDEAVRG